jgi:hypothetical protein
VEQRSGWIRSPYYQGYFSSRCLPHFPGVAGSLHPYN